jgi:predicted RNA-binding protein with EMAP domain
VTHDTSKDPRLLVARRACALLHKTLQQKTGVPNPTPKEKLAELAGAAESAVMAMLYSYQDPAELARSEQVRELTASAVALAEGLQPVLGTDRAPHAVRAGFEWCLRTFSGLPERLGQTARSMAAGVDLVAVRVATVARMGSLWLTRVDDSRREYPVVTNLPGVKAGTTLAVAFLPPREVGGQVSEAMFLGDRPLDHAPGTRLDETEVDAREAASIVHEEIAKH